MIRSLSVIIPAYNEESRLPKTLELVSRYLGARRLDFAEIVVVDDGSSDRTAELAHAFAGSQAMVRVLQNPGNRGKGYAVRHGMLSAIGDWRLFSDADLSTPISELDKLWGVATATEADVVIGSRALNRALIAVRQPAFRETAGKFFNLVTRAATSLRIHDTQCGFKLFSRRAADDCFPRQKLDRFGFDVEILFIAKLRGFRIEEVPVRWSHVDGTKVGLWNGAQSFFDLLRIRANQFKGRYQ